MQTGERNGADIVLVDGKRDRTEVEKRRQLTGREFIFCGLTWKEFFELAGLRVVGRKRLPTPSVHGTIPCPDGNVCTGGYVFHVLNRAVARQQIFDDFGDYAAFEKVLAEALDRVPVRLLSFV